MNGQNAYVFSWKLSCQQPRIHLLLFLNHLPTYFVFPSGYHYEVCNEADKKDFEKAIETIAVAFSSKWVWRVQCELITHYQCVSDSDNIKKRCEFISISLQLQTWPHNCLYFWHVLQYAYWAFICWIIRIPGWRITFTKMCSTQPENSAWDTGSHYAILQYAWLFWMW